MNATAAGKIAVTTAGTPVALSTDKNARAARISMQAIAGTTGAVYFGTPTMVKATLAGVLHVFAIPLATGPHETWEISPHVDADALYLGQYAIDADVNGEGLLVSYWTE